MQEEAARVLENCGAEGLLAIEIRDEQSIRFRLLKELAQRSGRDLEALRCVAKHYRYLSTYAEMEAMLLGIEPANSQLGPGPSPG